MKIFKNLLQILMGFMCFCTSQNVFAADNTEELAIRNREAVEFLQSIGAIEGDWGDWALTSTVKRSDAAQYFSVLLKESRGLLLPSSAPAKDVKINKDFAAAVYNVMLYDIIPAQDGKFNPNGYFTYGDMKYALCSMLGYNEFAEYTNGNEAQINNLVASAGFFKQVQYRENSPMTKADFAIVLKDALMSKMIYKEPDGEQTYEFDTTSDVSMLEEYLSVEVYKGIIKANKYTSTASTDGLGTDEVILGDMRCAVGNTNAADYIGCNVKAYIKINEDDDINTILNIDYENCNILVLDAANIEYDDSDSSIERIVYTDARGRIKKAKISSDADFFYNNVVCVPDKSDFKINNGNITLISNGNDNNYDVVKITAYENYIVDYVDTKNNIVYDKIKDKGGNQRTIDLSDTNKTFFRMQRTNGRPVEVQDLKRDNVITVYASKDGRYIDAMVTSDVITGAIDKVDSSSNRTSLWVDDEEYKFFFIGNDWGSNNDLRPQVGLSGTFYLDAQGFIAYAEYSTLEFKYGFIIGMGMEPADSSVVMRLVDEDGQQRTLTIPEKGIKINNYNNSVQERTSAEQIYNMLSDNHQLIQFIANSDDKVVKMNIAGALGDGELYNTDEFVLAEDLGNSNCTFNYSVYAFCASGSKPKATMISSTKCFVIKNVEDARLAKRGDVTVCDASALNKQVAVHGVKYYDVDKSFSAGAMVCVLNTDVSGETGFVGNICLFDNIKTCADLETGDIYSEISVYKGGKQVTYRVAENYELPEVEQGDILAIYLDYDKNVHKVHNVNKEIGAGSSLVLHGGDVYGSRVYFGREYMVGASKERLAMFKKDISDAKVLRLMTPTIYEVKRGGRKAEINPKASFSMVAETLEPREDSLIYYYSNEGYVYDIVIYR